MERKTKIIKQEHTRQITTAERKVDCVFVGKQCKRWHWKRTWPMRMVGGTCKDPAMKVGRQAGVEEIGSAFKI
jgi:hypothetical protein